jgi:serine/threonine-protein kinase
VLTGGTASDVRVVDRARRTLQRITFGASAARPEWTADGRRLAYGFLARGSWDVYSGPADGSGQAESLVVSSKTEFPSSWTPSGDTLVFWRQSPETRGDILYVSRGGGEQVFAGTGANESHPTLSPDGHWLAYVSDEAGRREVFVRPFPAGAGRWQVSAEGGVEPRWSRHGREIIYRKADMFLAVPVEARPTFSTGRPDTLFVGPYEFSGTRTLYDVTADGNELVVVGAADATRQLTVRLNPLADLLRGGPGARPAPR